MKILVYIKIDNGFDLNKNVRLTNMSQERYSRQMLFKYIGEKGQKRIENQHVLIIGMGALGTHLSEGLVRAGVGKLTIVDRDYIEFSNLQRQTLYTENDAKEALPKAIAAKYALTKIRSDIDIEACIEHVNYSFLEQYKTVDLILDATDNFDTRQLINDFSYKNGIPWIYGGVVQSTYVEATFIPGKTPCFNCLMPQLPSVNLTCDTVGVIQPAVTMTSSLQLKDALKLLTQNHIKTQLTYGDIWEGDHYTIGFSRMYRETCPTCGQHPHFPYLNREHRSYATLCGRDTVQYENKNISHKMLTSFLEQYDIEYRSNQFMTIFKFKGHRIVAFKGGRFLIHNMNKPQQAIQLIHQLFG